MPDPSGGKQAGRDRGGRFAKGASGNPAGRPAGVRNAQSLLVETLLQDDLEKIVAVVTKAALDGNLTAAMYVVDKLVPNARPRAVVGLEAIGIRRTGREALRDNLRAVMEAVAAGELTPDEGHAMTDLVLRHVEELSGRCLDNPPSRRAAGTAKPTVPVLNFPLRPLRT